ncbi:epididymal-specific lipocalin-6 isoform X1 [Equus caballus]|uniref:epididymal-specific lipocalin-6 isoform X1 n=1 Tax=Equus caballus TaxID=9796 RepID=UPI0038B29DBB
MRGVLLAALLALLSVPQARALWLGRLNPNQLLGSWYVLAKASGEKDFAVEKATKNIEGVVVTLTPENNLKMLSSRHRLERCDLNVVELLRQASGWVFENPALGVVEFRVLSTNFRDYAVVFTQLEFADEAFSTVELYSRSELASQEAVHLFAKWSKGLGFLSQQQAQLQRDHEAVGGTGRPAAGEPRPVLTAVSLPPSHLCAQGLPVNAVAPRAWCLPCPGGGWPGPALLTRPPGAGPQAGCSQGLSLWIPIKPFHKPARCLLLACWGGPCAGLMGAGRGAAFSGLRQAQGEEKRTGGMGSPRAELQSIEPAPAREGCTCVLHQSPPGCGLGWVLG